MAAYNENGESRALRPRAIRLKPPRHDVRGCAELIQLTLMDHQREEARAIDNATHSEERRGCERRRSENHQRWRDHRRYDAQCPRGLHSAVHVLPNRLTDLVCPQIG